MSLPRWIAPQHSKLVEKAPTGPQWVREIKFEARRLLRLDLLLALASRRASTPINPRSVEIEASVN
jgi:hypothetical protein